MSKNMSIEKLKEWGSKIRDILTSLGPADTEEIWAYDQILAILEQQGKLAEGEYRVEEDEISVRGPANFWWVCNEPEDALQLASLLNSQGAEIERLTKKAAVWQDELQKYGRLTNGVYTTEDKAFLWAKYEHVACDWTAEQHQEYAISLIKAMLGKIESLTADLANLRASLKPHGVTDGSCGTCHHACECREKLFEQRVADLATAKAERDMAISEIGPIARVNEQLRGAKEKGRQDGMIYACDHIDKLNSDYEQSVGGTDRHQYVSGWNGAIESLRYDTTLMRKNANERLQALSVSEPQTGDSKGEEDDVRHFANTGRSYENHYGKPVDGEDGKG